MILKREVHTLHVHGLLRVIKNLKCDTGLLCSRSYDRFVIYILYTYPFFVSSRNARGEKHCVTTLKTAALETIMIA